LVLAGTSAFEGRPRVITVAEAVFRYLAARRVNTIFGIPGVHTIEFYRGLAQTGIRHVLARHEQGAAFMADGFARASGRVAAILVITGPGLTNAATGIGQAYSDSVPMLVLTTVRARKDLNRERGCLHEIRDQRSVIAPLTGFSRTIFHADEIAAALDTAFEAMVCGRPRPAVIEFPLDILSQTIPPLAVPSEFVKPDAFLSALPGATKLIDHAKSLMVVAGGGCVQAPDHVRTFVEKSGAVLVTSVNGRGVLPENHPQSLGASLRLPGTLRALATADVVVAVGTELAETDTWISTLPIAGSVIRIDIDRNELNANRRADVALHGDAAVVLQHLTQLIEERPFDSTLKEQAHFFNERGQGPEERRHIRVLDTLREVLAEDSIIAADATLLAYTANFHPWIHQPRCYLHCTGYGALGYALPAGIGAKIAMPDRQVVVIIGDGGFQFTLQELSTAITEQVALPILLWDNGRHGAIANAMRTDGVPEIGVHLTNPDFIALGRAYGCATAEPNSLDEFAEAAGEALKAGRPTIIRIQESAPFLN
jgi:5-guanidino-2-oxopentanoate decarboxylase